MVGLSILSLTGQPTISHPEVLRNAHWLRTESTALERGARLTPPARCLAHRRKETKDPGNLGGTRQRLIGWLAGQRWFCNGNRDLHGAKGERQRGRQRGTYSVDWAVEFPLSLFSFSNLPCSHMTKGTFRKSHTTPTWPDKSGFSITYVDASL